MATQASPTSAPKATSFWGKYGSAITTGFGAITSAYGQNRQNQQNRDEAQRNRDFQERMSNTSIQRRMADMKLAGLNPILAGKWDASTPGGNMATMGNTGAAAAEGAKAGGVTAMQIAQIQNVRANTELTQNTSRKIAGEAVRGDLTGSIYEYIIDGIKKGFEQMEAKRNSAKAYPDGDKPADPLQWKETRPGTIAQATDEFDREFREKHNRAPTEEELREFADKYIQNAIGYQRK